MAQKTRTGPSSHFGLRAVHMSKSADKSIYFKDRWPPPIGGMEQTVRLDCPLSLKTGHLGNPGLQSIAPPRRHRRHQARLPAVNNVPGNYTWLLASIAAVILKSHWIARRFDHG